MADREKVIKCLEACTGEQDDCAGHTCPYWDFDGEVGCRTQMELDALTLLKEQDEEHRRLLSWLGKFCRHIDNGDSWLTDEENIAFFKEKMKQQFGDF